jgi:UDP-glucose 4-epimerase
VAIFCGRLLEGRPLVLYGDGLQTRDYVFVRDVAEATFRAATRELPPPDRLDARSFNIGTGRGTPVIDLARMLLRISDCDAPVEYAPKRAGEQQHSFLDVEKAAARLGWRARTSLDDGLARTYAWFSERHQRAMAKP